MTSPPYLLSARLSYGSHLARFDRPAATTRPRWSAPRADIIDHRHVPSGGQPYILWRTIWCEFFVSSAGEAYDVPAKVRVGELWLSKEVRNQALRNQLADRSGTHRPCGRECAVDP
jgi:hypothetical protein